MHWRTETEMQVIGELRIGATKPWPSGAATKVSTRQRPEGIAGLYGNCWRCAWRAS
jgi:hypothetical protein